MAANQRYELTDGQKDCLRLVGANLTSKEIAIRLGISHHTVNQRLDSARQKLEVENRRQAAQKFMFLEKAAEDHLTVEAYPAEDDQIIAIEDQNGGAGQHDELGLTHDVVDIHGTATDRATNDNDQSNIWSLPWITGNTEGISSTQRLYAVLKVAVFVAVAFSAILTLMAGAMSLFNNI